jgi:hypothetical protein
MEMVNDTSSAADGSVGWDEQMIRNHVAVMMKAEII